MKELFKKEFRIGNLKIKVPIIQGGMGVGISLSRLAGAVANEGGVGVISAAGLGLVHRSPLLSYPEANIEGLKKEIRKAKKISNGIIGVNIMVAMSDFDDLVKTALDEKVDIIFAGGGLPMNLPKFLKHGSTTKLVPIISSKRAAKLICEKWKSAYNYLPDAIVVEGPKAGGHLGFKKQSIDDSKNSLDEIVNDTVNMVREYEERSKTEIPVIAAGGIYTGEDIFNILKKGAKAVQIGSRFVTTKECDASLKFKQTYINAGENDAEIILSPVGMPGRAIKNKFLEKIKQGLKIPVKCPFHCIRTCDITTSPYCIMLALYNAYKGNMNYGFAFAGSNAYKATSITSVKEIFAELISDWEKAIERSLKRK